MEFNTPPSRKPPDNNLVWAILCTVLCCVPLGVISIIKSTKVGELWAMGDFAGAQKAADDAKKYAIWGAAITLIAVVLCIIFAVAITALGNGF